MMGKLNNKKYLFVAAGVVLTGVGILFFSMQAKNVISPPSNNLYPETSISHGHGLAVDIQDPNKLYIATHYGLFVLINEKDLYRVGKSKDDYMGFSVHPTAPNVFFTSGHSSFGGNLGFQKSEDGGVTWKKVSDGVNGPVDFHAMAVSPVNPNLIYGWYAGNLQRSENQGKDWEIVNREIVAMYLAADPEDENKLYAATPRGQGVIVSKDRGETWATLSPELEGGAVSVIALHPKDAKIMLAFSEKLNGLGKSNDGGQTWTRINENFNNEVIFHIAFNKIDPNIVYALTHGNKLFKSSDGGDTWTQIH